MALDAWFPLAIYYEDLADSAEHNLALAERIKDLCRASVEKRTSATSSWTGDVHNVDRLHLDPAFDWLTDQVGHHALQYLEALGHDLKKIDVYIQRSWPVVALRSQGVGRHVHYTAHLSAVYYVAASKDDPGGRISFLNDHKPNELSGGIGTAMTGGYSQHNALNYGSAIYQPIAGRLLLFPAKQPHEVEPSQTDEERISISYDLVITSRGAPYEGHHEFLMPPPEVWKQVGRSEPATFVRSPARPAPAEGRTPLAEVSSYSRAADAFTIPDRDGHTLWEAAAFGHCSSLANWRDYAAILQKVPPEDWMGDESGAILSWHQCRDWRVCRDAVDRLYVHLRRRDVPLDGANLTAPVLQKRLAGAVTPYQRGTAHLCIYVRIDHDDAEACTLEFAEGGSVALAAGEMVIASGFRRQRLQGASHVVHFQLDLPAIARSGALQLTALQSPEVPDRIVFAAITAQPISDALPPAGLLVEKIEWLDARARRRNRHESCPAVQRFLVERANPDSATKAELDIIRSHGNRPETSNDCDGRLIENVAALDAGECETLCRFAEAHMTSIVPDTVDDLPEYQVNLSVEGLTELLGRDKVAALLKMPEALGAPSDLAARDFYQRIDIFVRMYSPHTRPYIAFHSDTCSYTVNIALNDDSSFDGGKLLAVNGTALTAPLHGLGTAILHAGDVVHGVSKIERGTRYSLILFFYRKADSPAVGAPPPAAAVVPDTLLSATAAQSGNR
jgi:uncharacterized protein (TIGR02466 family)